jgi:uncharacterized damage-inducible protein DinB
MEMAMVDVPVIQELYRYNRWANDRMFQAVSILTQAEFTKNLASSHPSVRDTVTHIVWAEWIWLQRWRDRGQLTTMLRQLAARTIPTDFLVFHDELESHPA